MPVMRDYYCSSTSKAGYVWQPMDLICQSGYLDNGFAPKLIDCAVLGWDRTQALDRIKEINPAAIFSLVGTAAVPDDFEFLAEAFRETGARIFVSGDLARFHPHKILEAYPFIEGVVLDFTSGDLADLLAGRPGPFPSLALRTEPLGELPVAKGEFDYPIPRHDLFLSLPYRMTFLGRPFASILANYGCPFRCRYCNSCTIGFSRRSPDNLFEELDYLHGRAIRYLFVKDFTFNAVPDEARMILERWISRAYKFRWIGYFRAERIDGVLAGLLARTGCQMAQIGIETADADILRGVKPGADVNGLEQGIARLREAGVPFGGHFVIGLPGEDDRSFERTIELSRRLGLSYASFNIFTPRPGSALADSESEICAARMDPSVSRDSGGSGDALSLRVREANRRFFLRPAYLLTLLKNIRTPRVFLSLAAMGASLLRQRLER